MEKFRDYLASYQAKPMGQERVYAVFLPLVWADGDWHILYQVRSQAVSQPGEVSFPGGALEVGETAKEAAIRETVEELHVAREAVQVWGELDYIVYQGRTIHCFVGQLQVDDWRVIQPNEEVASLFTVSVATLKEHPPVYYHLRGAIDGQSDFPFERIKDGVDYRFGHQHRSIPFYEGLEEIIWGMTAQFTHHFIELLTGIK